MAAAAKTTGGGRIEADTHRMPWHRPGFDPLSAPSWSEVVGTVDSRPFNWDGADRGGQEQGFDQHEAFRRVLMERLRPFSPFIAFAAGAFPATLTWDSLRDSLRGSGDPLLAELLTGIELYEFYMRVVAGAAFAQGSVVNRHG